jgi:hypothetical protein
MHLQMRVSKEVQALRDYEQALLKGYQAYLKTLLAAATAKPAAAGNSGSSMLATKRVAVRCMGQLLVARPGFNYCSDLLQALVPMMLGPDAQVQGAACDAIRQLLQEDVQVGSLSGLGRRCVWQLQHVGISHLVSASGFWPWRQWGNAEV